MKTLLLILCTILTISASAQKTAKLYQKAQTAYDHRDFEEVISYLDRLPAEEKNSTQYNKLLSLSFDAMRQYGKAIKFYTLYTAQVKDSASMQRLVVLKDNEEKRIAAAKAKFEKIKDCPQCHGSDSVPNDIVCTKCLGFKQIKKRCSRCAGKGYNICGACNGSGSIKTAGSNPSPCSSCSSSGSIYCMQCDHGSITTDCRTCSATGYVTVQVKCDKHE